MKRVNSWSQFCVFAECSPDYAYRERGSKPGELKPTLNLFWTSKCLKSSKHVQLTVGVLELQLKTFSHPTTSGDPLLIWVSRRCCTMYQVLGVQSSMFWNICGHFVIYFLDVNFRRFCPRTIVFKHLSGSFPKSVMANHSVACFPFATGLILL